MIKLYQHAQSNKFAISLQNLKKELRNGSYFLHADKQQRFDKLGLLFLIEVARCVQSTQNRKLVIFLQYVKKKMLQLFLCSTLMQNIQIFYLGPVMFVVTCFLAQQSCRNVLLEHCNTILNSIYVGRSFHLCNLCSKLMHIY